LGRGHLDKIRVVRTAEPPLNAGAKRDRTRVGRCNGTTDRTSKKGQKKWYSGKKKCHTIKTLIFADAHTKRILAIAQHWGSTHDFELFKQAYEGANDKIQFLADSGFQGILRFHMNSLTPYKRSKHHPLTEEKKRFNHELSSKRISIEHINAWIKRFKILSYKYRNKRLRHGLRTSLICGIYNAELG